MMNEKLELNEHTRYKYMMHQMDASEDLAYGPTLGKLDLREILHLEQKAKKILSAHKAKNKNYFNQIFLTFL